MQNPKFVYVTYIRTTPEKLWHALIEPEFMVKLTVVHESDTPESKLIVAVSNGWPLILASLKSLLETGESLEATRESARVLIASRSSPYLTSPPWPTLLRK